MRRTKLPRAWVVSCLVVGFATSAVAGSSPEDEARRLDDHLFFVKSLRRGWEPLLADMDRTLTTLEGSPAEALRPVRVTVDTARETVAGMNAQKGEAGEGRALELYDLLARTAVEEPKRPAHHKSCAEILMTKADRAEHGGKDADAFDLARSALGHVKGFEKAFDMIARLGLKVGEALKLAEDYDVALDKLTGTLETLRDNGVAAGSPALSKVQVVIDAILGTTGPLRIVWLGDPQVFATVKGPVADFSKASLSLSGSAKSPPVVTADKPRRVRTGAWHVDSTGTNGGKWAGDVTITKDGGEFVQITAIPDGMVYVPAAGGADAFLMDRTEVSNAQWVSLGGASHGGRPTAAVAGVSHRDADTWARSNGRRLPTRDQWTHAAFGAPNAESPKYPWGNDEGVPGTHFADQGDEPQDVTTCPAGESRFSHCLNMAGNVWEWLDDGWLIGGSYKNTQFFRDVNPPDGATFQPYRADFLRNPLPSPQVYEGLAPQVRDRHYNYKASESTLQQAGLRCVVPLGKPRR